MTGAAKAMTLLFMRFTQEIQQVIVEVGEGSDDPYDETRDITVPDAAES